MLLRRKSSCYFYVLSFCASVFFVSMLMSTFMCYCDQQLSSNDASATQVAYESNELKSCQLVIVILSSPDDFSIRKVIRETWLQEGHQATKQQHVCHAFPLGTLGLSLKTATLLSQEKDRFGDLLFLPTLKEHFRNLSMKMLLILSNLEVHYKFDYVLKVDSDSFVNLPAFMDALQSVSRLQHSKQKRMLYWGFMDGRSRVKRRGKYAESEWKLCDRYLPYAVGGGYVLSHDLVKYVSVNRDLLKLYNSEDVTVGAWFAGLDVNYVHDPRFDTEYLSRGCSNAYLITHKHSEDALVALYANLRDTGYLCQAESSKRMSYMYNWNVVPSQCCNRTEADSKLLS